MAWRTGKALSRATALDRTAVLFLGLAAGFLIGLSFNDAGRRQLFGWLTGDVPRNAPQPVVAGAAPSITTDPSRPELAALTSPAVLDRFRRTGKIRVGVFGDSFGDGYWASLYRQLPPGEGYEVLRFSKEATGFTRYRTLNLEDRARRQVAVQPIDIAVISFGANDAQPIFEGGHLRALMSPAWQAIIGERIDRFVAVARSTGAAVFWVGLPVMRSASLDDDVRAMDAFYARRMKLLGVPFIDTRAASLDAGGRFNKYLPDAGSGPPKLMRTGDGVHMTIPGYERLTAGLVRRLKADVALLRARASGAPAPAAAPAAPAPVVAAGTAKPRPVRSRAVAEPPAAPPTPAPRTEETPAPPPVAIATPAEPPAPVATAAPDAEAGKTAKANRRERARERKHASPGAGAGRDGAPPAPAP